MAEQRMTKSLVVYTNGEQNAARGGPLPVRDGVSAGGSLGVPARPPSTPDSQGEIGAKAMPMTVYFGLYARCSHCGRDRMITVAFLALSRVNSNRQTILKAYCWPNCFAPDFGVRVPWRGYVLPLMVTQSEMVEA